MKILLNNNDLNEALKNVSKLGFVPTMGSLEYNIFWTNVLKPESKKLYLLFQKKNK